MRNDQKEHIQIQMLAASRELDRLIDYYKDNHASLGDISFSDKLIEAQTSIRDLKTVLKRKNQKPNQNINSDD